jgi:hypothetical protein
MVMILWTPLQLQFLTAKLNIGKCLEHRLFSGFIHRPKVSNIASREGTLRVENWGIVARRSMSF